MNCIVSGGTHFKKTSVSYCFFFFFSYPAQPPLTTRRVVLMFTVYKGNMQLSLTHDEHLYKVEDST